VGGLTGLIGSSPPVNRKMRGVDGTALSWSTTLAASSMVPTWEASFLTHSSVALSHTPTTASYLCYWLHLRGTGAWLWVHLGSIVRSACTAVIYIWT
jgi:hypothetical protein